MPADKKHYYICGHTNILYASVGLCKKCYNQIYKQLVKPNPTPDILDCPHSFSQTGENIKSYANNMCK